MGDGDGDDTSLATASQLSSSPLLSSSFTHARRPPSSAHDHSATVHHSRRLAAIHPASTLCGGKAGSRGSPNSISDVCSPPNAEDLRRWDLLYAAAGLVARMRLTKETTPFYSSKPYAPLAKPSPVTAHQQNHKNPQAYAQSHLSYQMLQAAKRVLQRDICL
ncbi:hypothetical protein ACS0TY_017484 [Phlomoides rotata]